MFKRFNSIFVTRLFLLILMGTTSISVLAAAEPAAGIFLEGKDYQAITVSSDKTQSVAPTITKGKVQVIEFFSYGCPWCNRLEPELEKWLATKPNNVEFRRVPVTFESNWALLAKAYYALEALGAEKKLTPFIFQAIHKDDIRFDSEDSLVTFVAAHGVSKEDFASALNFSPGIDAQLKRGQDLMAYYAIASVPTLVINGKYKTDTGLTNGDVKKMVEVLNFLVKKPG